MTINDERNPYTKNWLKNDETHISNLCFIFNIFRKGPLNYSYFRILHEVVYISYNKTMVGIYKTHKHD